MKKIYTFKSVMLLFAIFTTGLFSAQTTHTIVLTCDTTNITKENVNDVCSFGQDSGVSNEDFTLNAQLGDIVVWRGVANNSGMSSSIELHQVNYQRGTNIFGQPTLKDVGGIIAGEIVQGDTDDEEKYNLKFKVYVDGRQVNGMFTIDPKIRIIR